MSEADEAPAGLAPENGPHGSASGRAFPPRFPRRHGRSQLAGLAESYALLGVWVVVIVLFAVLRHSTFATVRNFQTIFGSQSVLLILALALILPLVVGAFDLSVGANLGLAACFVAWLNVEHHFAIVPAIVLAILLGLVIGSINGILVVFVGVDALVATLGMGTLLTGLSYWVTNYDVISGVSPKLVTVTSKEVFGLPVSFWFSIGLATVLWYLFRYTPIGRHLLFTGAGLEVARLSGLRVQRLRFGAFAVCGILAALAGVVLTGTFGSADANSGPSFLLPAYAAAFLGATTVRPGQFNPWGTVLAVYFLVTGITGLQLLGLQSWIQEVFYGSALVVAVTISRVVRRRSGRA